MSITNYVYNKKYDTFCFQNCINYILKTRGVDNSELYINKSLSLVIEKDSGISLKYHLDNHCGGLVPPYSDKIETYRSDEESTEIMKEAMERKDESHDIIMGVDSYELPYLPFYQKSHGLHSVIVNEIDFEKGEVNLKDCMEPWYFEGNVELEKFVAARTSDNRGDGGMFSDIAIHNIWKKVDFSDYEESEQKLVQEQIKLSLDQYYKGSEDENSISGILAFKYIVGYLEAYSELTVEEQDCLLEGFHRLLFRINHRRIFWTHFLDSIPDSLKDELLQDYQKQFESLQEDWEKLLYKILMLKIRKKEKLWNDVIASLNSIIERDTECGEILAKYAKTRE